MAELIEQLVNSQGQGSCAPYLEHSHAIHPSNKTRKRCFTGARLAHLAITNDNRSSSNGSSSGSLPGGHGLRAAAARGQCAGNAPTRHRTAPTPPPAAPQKMFSFSPPRGFAGPPWENRNGAVAVRGRQGGIDVNGNRRERKDREGKEITKNTERYEERGKRAVAMGCYRGNKGRQVTHGMHTCQR